MRRHLAAHAERIGPCSLALAASLGLVVVGPLRAFASEGDADGGAEVSDGGVAPVVVSDASTPNGAVVDSGAEPMGTVRAPVLVTFVEAEYPPDARSRGIAGVVVLRLDIDEVGVVTSAEVVQAAGAGFDEAARAAALRFRFAAARRGGLAVPARILYRYEFRARAAVASSQQDTTPPSPSPDGASRGADAGANRSPGGDDRTLSEDTAVDVNVVGVSDAERRRQSAEAVTVVETTHSRRESADLGEVLARTQGVDVRRGGGLGSGTRFSLNGLTDDQVRFFLDGVPLELAGFPQGIADVPVNLIDRVEIYSGVVPVRFGADALGGAVNLVTDDRVATPGLALSYQVGSFETHRLAASARWPSPPQGVFVRATGYLDYARNDYPVDVEVPDERGQLSPARIYRFHDAYRAAGANAELGFMNRPWARRLSLRLYASDYLKEYQHNVVMTVPYGGVTYGESAAGAAVRYERTLAGSVDLSAVGGPTLTRGTFLDVATCVYDWFGRCVRQRSQPGETGSRPYDQVFWDRAAFVRANATWRIRPGHALRLALAPTWLSRTGDERRQADPNVRDPLSAKRVLLTEVNGLEYQVDTVGDRLQNVVFAKQYLQLLDSEEPRPGNLFRERARRTQRFGFGEALRVRVTPWLNLKASYEWATRLPRPDEVFGDNAFVVANLGLEPETSHNVNLSLALDRRGTRSGGWRATLNGFVRQADRLIVLLGSDRVQSYQNVFGARVVGAEGTCGWTSPREHAALDVGATYVDMRNTSRAGTFGDFVGDRIPNRPYLFGNTALRVQTTSVFAPGDELSLSWRTRWVHAYFRAWESVGLPEFKQVIPAQLVHGAGLGYVVRGKDRTFSTTLEVQNLTDEAVFDVFGVQRPGRAFYFKTTAEL